MEHPWPKSRTSVRARMQRREMRVLMLERLQCLTENVWSCSRRWDARSRRAIIKSATASSSSIRSATVATERGLYMCSRMFWCFTAGSAETRSLSSASEKRSPHVRRATRKPACGLLPPWVGQTEGYLPAVRAPSHHHPRLGQRQRDHRPACFATSG